jgi:putative addiction module killer protein
MAKEYVDARGFSPFHEWFSELHAPEAAKVTGAIIRMEQGNFGNVKGVGSGVFEYVLNFGPGYRIYFGKDGDQIIVLLGGGRKSGSRPISTWQLSGGRISNGVRKQGDRDGFDQRVQIDSSRQSARRCRFPQRIAS